MDRFKCPLHGKIVARDELGQIVNEKDKTNSNTPVELPAWQDPELIADINANAGKSLIQINKNKRSTKKKSNLTDISQESETPKTRLERRLFTAKSLNKVGAILDSIERRLHNEKFHHNYNYSLQL